MYGLSIVTPPAEEPITLAEAKAHLRVTFDDDNSYITDLIIAARQWFEEQTYQQVITATWDLLLDEFPTGDDPIRIPRAPLASVTSVSYTDTAGDPQTWSSDDYKVSATRQPGIIRPAYGEVYPIARAEADSVTVRFVAGYGAASAVPDLIKAAIKLIVGQMYEFREELISGTIINQLPTGAQRIIAMYDLGDELLEYGAVGTT